MDKSVLKGFADEMEKEALVPKFLLKAKGAFSGWRAGRMGEKAMIRQVSREGKKLKFTDPEVDISKFRAERMTELREVGAEKAKKMIEGGRIKGRGFVAQHKGKLLLGGAAVGALALANSADKKNVGRRQRLASSRYSRIPNRVYYQ
ncbi:hypothetical protein LCGC14_1174400 [marine sediment metagenome]|uniref:Uncharacterized protein n=1 Tax=marine sediment metagenome TaxID=412755 RepID=A0A0F9LP67_9ZZZZ